MFGSLTAIGAFVSFMLFGMTYTMGVSDERVNVGFYRDMLATYGGDYFQVSLDQAIVSLHVASIFAWIFAILSIVSAVLFVLWLIYTAVTSVLKRR